MYGYEIVQNISKVIDVNEGTIYPILRRLTKDEYFETYILESNEGPARKYYKITAEGIKNLNKLVREWKDFVGAVNIILNEYQKEVTILNKSEFLEILKDYLGKDFSEYEVNDILRDYEEYFVDGG